MRDRQKKASGSQADSEFGSFGNRTGFVVGGDRYFGVPGVYFEPHVARRGNHDRAHRQVVGRDGREHQAGALGSDDRTAHAERIGRRAGRCADDQAVAVVGCDHLVVHVRFDRDHARALALDDHFIDRIAGRDAVAEVARDLEHRSGLAFEFAGGDQLEDIADAAVAGYARQKTQMSRVDAYDGDFGPSQSVNAVQKRTVAAVTYQHRLRRLGTHRPSVTVGRIDGYAGEPFDLGSELLIDRVIEPETGDRVEHLVQVAGRVDDALPGKKYDFHPSCLEK